MSGNLRNLFTRIGYESGTVKRVMDENLISWGYFIDHNIFGPHCNAHPNNFLVLDLESPSNPNKCVIAPVDFDMSYDYETFVSIIPDDPKTYGTQDRNLYDGWTGMEKYELESTLGGLENMGNFKYRDEAMEALRTPLMRAVETLFRDQMVLTYRRSYDKVSSLEEREAYRANL